MGVAKWVSALRTRKESHDLAISTAFAPDFAEHPPTGGKEVCI